MRFWTGTAYITNIPELPRLAQMLDDAGHDGVLLSDHLIYPEVLSEPFPHSPKGDGLPPWEPETPFPDTWVTIGAMAAVTTRLQFSNSVYIAPARPLLEVAKQVGTASVLSGGRVSLGAGAGWMPRRVRPPRRGLRRPGPAVQRNDPGPPRALVGRLGRVARRVLRHPPAHDGAASRPAAADPVRRARQPRAAAGRAVLRRLGRDCVHLGRRRHVHRPAALLPRRVR